MNPTFVIRETRRGDLSAIVSLWREMMDVHAGLDERFRFVADAEAEFARHARRMQKSACSRIFVADLGGAVIGYVLAETQIRPPIYPAGRYGFISDLCVAERYRRRGAGRALVERALAWLRSEEVNAVELLAAERNPDAIAFWESLGFKPYLRLLRLDWPDEARTRIRFYLGRHNRDEHSKGLIP